MTFGVVLRFDQALTAVFADCLWDYFYWNPSALANVAIQWAAFLSLEFICEMYTHSLYRVSDSGWIKWVKHICSQITLKRSLLNGRSPAPTYSTARGLNSS